ncbi:MAG: hypothetical protein IT385_26830 [Deltaproteobacteria bacterium]|nr:hypothetical protein [Deltaproteobacteria bacterium]
MTASRWLFALLAPAALLACDDESGIALDFDPVATTAAPLTALTLGTFEVTRLEALVTEVKLLPDKDPAKEADNAKFKAKGDFWVDVLSPEDSIIPPIPLPADTYKKVEFKFDKPKSGAGLDGTDAVIALDATHDGQAIELRLGATQKVTLRDVSGLALAEGGTSTFLVQLDIPGWFAGVDLDALEVDDDGVIRIDDKTNKAAHDTIAANVVAAIKLARKP